MELETGKQQKLTAEQLADISTAFDGAVADTDDHLPDLCITIRLNNGEVKKEERPINGLA